MNYRGANHEQPWPEWDTLVYRRHSISKRSLFPLVAPSVTLRQGSNWVAFGAKRTLSGIYDGVDAPPDGIGVPKWRC